MFYIYKLVKVDYIPVTVIRNLLAFAVSQGGAIKFYGSFLSLYIPKLYQIFFTLDDLGIVKTSDSPLPSLNDHFKTACILSVDL